MPCKSVPQDSFICVKEGKNVTALDELSRRTGWNEQRNLTLILTGLCRVYELTRKHKYAPFVPYRSLNRIKHIVLTLILLQ